MDAKEEVFRIVGLMVEGQATQDEIEQLTDLLKSDQSLVDIYTQYMCLHSQLTWDTAHTQHSLPETEVPAEVREVAVTVARRDTQRPLRAAVAAAVVACAAVLLAIPFLVPGDEGNEVADIDRVAPVDNGPEVQPRQPENDDTDLTPIRPIQVTENTNRQNDPRHSTEVVENHPREPRLKDGFTDAEVIASINRLLQKSWEENEVTPAPVASDSEFIRRATLTIAGRIPTLQESRKYLSSKSPRRKTELLNDLLASTARADHLATIWTNLLVGRTERRGVNRESLFDFLADSFEDNTAWIDITGDLITATGRNDENGATNFLLAHLNNEATPATAVTARLFLGEQISCVQCHDHPFTKGIRQEDYWALNAFFKDTVREVVREPRQQGRYMTCRLVDRQQVERITHFEARNGEQRAVLPRYDNVTLPASDQESRRRRLASLLARDSNTKISRSMVNRMWAHFFGYGFTPAVDDMGPHADVSHPELLDLLTEAFAKSDYDLQRLSLWIVSSEAWQLSGASTGDRDVPEHGELPLFSRVYPRRMSPEQVYESVRVAIRSSSGQSLSYDSGGLQHRREWVGQFAQNYDTDENDESVNFEGTISQALVMMNGVEVESAIQMATKAVLTEISPAPAKALETVALAILSREPTSAEEKAFRRHQMVLARQMPGPQVFPRAVEDMMWAYLNSSEFVLVQ